MEDFTDDPGRATSSSARGRWMSPFPSLCSNSASRLTASPICQRGGQWCRTSPPSLGIRSTPSESVRALFSRPTHRDRPGQRQSPSHCVEQKRGTADTARYTPARGYSLNNGPRDTEKSRPELVLHSEPQATSRSARSPNGQGVTSFFALAHVTSSAPSIQSVRPHVTQGLGLRKGYVRISCFRAQGGWRAGGKATDLWSQAPGTRGQFLTVRGLER